MLPSPSHVRSNSGSVSDAALLESLEPRRLLSGVEAGTPIFDHALYYPEGFAGSTITEFLPLGNPNDAIAQYRVIAHFEAEVPDQVLAEGSLAANSRGGITISRAADHSEDLVEQGQPYSLEVQSTEPLVASLSHYDFGSATGETFTDTAAGFWSLPQLGTGPGRHDFIVWYNTAPVAANITVRFVAENGSTLTTLSTTTRAQARGGLDLSLINGLPASGTFAAVVSADQLIVVAATRYFSQDGQSRASTELGTSGPGATGGVAPLGSLANGATEEIALFDPREQLNPSPPPVSVTLTFRADDDSVPPIVQMLTLVQNGVTKFDPATIAAQLGSHKYAVEYSSSVFLVGRIVHHEHGEDAATSFTQRSAERSAFADGFMDPARAGINVFETIGISRPAGAVTGATFDIVLRFSGQVFVQQFSLSGNGVFFVDLHAWNDLLQHINVVQQYYYTVEVRSDTPLAVTMWHYDLTLGAETPAGGFSTGSQPQPVTRPPDQAMYDLLPRFALGHGAGATPLGSVLNVPLGSPTRIDLTLLSGVFNFDANGETVAGNPPAPATNQGMAGLFGDVELSGPGAVLAIAASPRVSPFTFGPSMFDGVLGPDGRTITGFDATLNAANMTIPWPDGSPRPTPPARGAEDYARVYRFSIDLADTTTPRVVSVRFTGQGYPVVAWSLFSENPPPGDGSDGTATYLALTDLPPTRVAPFSLTIQIG